MQGERYNRWKNELSKFKTQGAKASLNSWLETSRLEEKFQRDRAYMLLKGEPWKEKKPQQKAKDDICEQMAQKILNGEITVDRYIDRMIEIMGDYDNWEFKKLSFVFTNIHLPSVNVHKYAFSIFWQFFF